jgi:hypothetical protein
VTGALRVALVLLLFAHAVAHLVGFVVPWRLATLPEMPYRTTILGGALDLGAVGIRIYGLLWLGLGVAFAIAAGALLLSTPWWYRLTLISAAWSLVMCVAGWPDARFGVAANLVVLALAIVSMYAGWLRAHG